MRDILVTNNIKVFDAYKDVCDVVFLDVTYGQILESVRDYIHLGHRLLTHPLSGSVKPNETPFKSVLVSGEKGKLDLDSLSIIENSIMTAIKFSVKFKSLTQQMREDFERVDYTLISGALSGRVGG